MHSDRRIARLVGNGFSAQFVALRVMRERGFVVGCVLQCLAEREFELGPLILRQVVALQLQAHGVDVGRIKPEGLQIRETPVGLAKAGVDPCTTSIGRDRFIALTRGFERMAITQHQSCLVRKLCDQLAVDVDRGQVVAGPAQDRSL